MKNLAWFSEIGVKDIPIAGGKGANLGEMTQAGLPVPPGFVITADAYYTFLKANKLDKVIKKLTYKLDPEDSKKLNQVADAIQKAIRSHPLPKKLEQEIIKAYHELGKGLVAVRSSATAEDLPDASFAGQQETFLNTNGDKDLLKSVRLCWASLFEARAIYYRIVNKFDNLKVGIAVPVQKMIESDISGIMFTADPVTDNRDVVMIDAGLGLGEAIVLGSVDPDNYIYDKNKKEILSKKISDQGWKISLTKEGNTHVTLSKEESTSQKLTDDQIKEVAELGMKVEQHYKKPMDMEWAIEKNKLYMIQARPITTLDKGGVAATQPAPDSTTEKPAETENLEVIVKGAAASIGQASGPVKIIHKPSEIDNVLKGDVLVTEMTNPDYVPAMHRAVAIVTDTGGVTSHAAIVSRELGIPCVVGTGTATSHLKTGQVVTVDGAHGVVYKGNVVVKKPIVPTQGGVTSRMTQEVPVTATKVYLNLAEPEKAAEYSELPVDGVGLLRAEFMIAGIGEHPKSLVERGQAKEYVSKLAAGISTICQAFNPRPVVYRATDFKTNEYKSLKGGEKFEPTENNPMIGYRGAARYIAEPDLFALELEALKTVRDGQGLKNLNLMIPFVRTVDEYRKVRDLVHKSGLRQGSDFKLWIMVEVPSAVWEIDKYFEEDIDGVSIGSNDLTQLMLGIDRDNERFASEFDERYPAVMEAIIYVIKSCRKNSVTCSICGQAPSIHPEITEQLVKAGITSISVSPDMALTTRKLIASVEKKLLLSQVLDSVD